MFLITLQIILAIVYYVGLPVLASVPAVILFLPTIIIAVRFLIGLIILGFAAVVAFLASK